MKLLKEFKGDFDYEVITEGAETGKPGKLFVKGIIQRANTKNQNGRIYPKEILFREIENYKKLVAERRSTGCLDHDDSPVIDLKHVSHLITEVWTEDDVVFGKVEILPTPMGNIARTLIESNVKLGISSRALGSVYSRGDADIVQDDLHLICFDLVSEPSTPLAFMSLTESRDYSKEDLKKIFNKSDRIDRIANDLLGLVNKK